MLTDRREDIFGHPLLEPLGFLFAGLEDQGVETGFVDDFAGLHPAGGHQLEDSLLVVVEITGEIGGGQTKDITDILGEEPGGAVLVSDADVESPANGQWELKGGDVVHGVCSLPIGKARVKPHPCQPPAPTTRGN